MGIQAIAASAWLYFMPGGFPVTHLRFFANHAITGIALFPISTRLICIAAILIGARISVTAFALG
ncbi:MAG: hypothetical protein WCO60_19515 [Verrucomicrobiota bacterium]